MIRLPISRTLYDTALARAADADRERESVDLTLARTEAKLEALQVALVRADAALVAVESERDYLRGKVDALTDSIVRMQRKEHGMTEVPRPAKPEQEPIPMEAITYLQGWSNPASRRMELQGMLKKRADGKSWEQILREAMEPRDGVS